MKAVAVFWKQALLVRRYKPAEKRYAHNTAVRMPGQHQVNIVFAEPPDKIFGEMA